MYVHANDGTVYYSEPALDNNMVWRSYLHTMSSAMDVLTLD